MTSQPQRDDAVAGAADDALRQSLQHTLRQSDQQSNAGELQALQDRAVAQWALRGASQPLMAAGPWGKLQLAWADRRMQLGAAALVVVMVTGLQLVRTQAEPNVDDLLEPDVLALMAMGEL